MQVKAWKRKKMPIFKRFCLIYLRSGYYMLIDETMYAEKRVKQFMSDTMVGSVKEDRRYRGKQRGPPKSHKIAIQVPRCRGRRQGEAEVTCHRQHDEVRLDITKSIYFHQGHFLNIGQNRVLSNEQEYLNKMTSEYYSDLYLYHFHSTNIFGYPLVDFWTTEYI